MFLSLPTAFGLDISDSALKLISLHRDHSRIFIKSFGQVDLPAGLISRGEILNLDQLARLIRGLTASAKGEKISSWRVVVNLPESRTYVKAIKIPAAALTAAGVVGDAKKNVREIIETETEKHFPVPIEECYLKWQKLETDRQSLQTPIIAAVAPKKIVDDYVNLLESAGLLPVILDIEALSIVRALLQTDSLQESQIILDLGASRAGLIFAEKGVVYLSLSLPISGNQLTRNIAQTLKMDLAQAEKIKIECGLDEKRCQGALRTLITATLNELVQKTKEAMTFYQSINPNRQIKKITLCGGGASLLGLAEHFQKAIKLPVDLGDPFANFRISSNSQINNFNPNHKLKFTTAIGLALAGLDY